MTAPAASGWSDLPDGIYARWNETKVWWSRLKNALGTTSSDFVNACVFQLQASARLPGGRISEIAVNAALAMIEAAQPRDEIEGALAVQMSCTHSAVMAVMGRLGNGCGGERRVAALGSAAARLLKAYAIQVECLRRRRSWRPPICSGRACPCQRWRSVYPDRVYSGSY